MFLDLAINIAQAHSFEGISNFEKKKILISFEFLEILAITTFNIFYSFWIIMKNLQSFRKLFCLKFVVPQNKRNFYGNSILFSTTVFSKMPWMWKFYDKLVHNDVICWIDPCPFKIAIMIWIN